MIKNGRWRGRMPFRQRSGSGRAHSDERDLTITKKEGVANLPPPRRRPGSYTAIMHDQHIRELLVSPYGGIYIAFNYRMSRHKTVRVVGLMPRLCHIPEIGAGTKGFTLRLFVETIDGMRPDGFARLVMSTGFVWSRVRDMEFQTLKEKVTRILAA